MELTTDQMQMIMVDAQTGREPRVQGPEADEFREDLKPDIALAKKNGWVLAIPQEWPEVE